MFTIIDWMTFSFVFDQNTGSVMVFHTKEEAESHAKENLQDGLWSVIEVPGNAWAYFE